MRRMKMIKQKTYRRVFQCLECVFYVHSSSNSAIFRGVFVVNCEMGDGLTLMSSEGKHVAVVHFDPRTLVMFLRVISIVCEHARRDLCGFIVHWRTNMAFL